jgi:hypothetical protein
VAKALTFLISIVLMIELTSCHSYFYLSNQQDYEAYQDKKHVYALDLITNNDSMVYFCSGFPGKLSKNEVRGPKQVLLEDFKPDSVLFNTKQKISYAIKKDIKYRVIHRNDTILVRIASDTTCISFSEIKQIHIKKFEQGKSALLALGIGGAYGGLVYLLLYLAFSNMTLEM